MKTFENIDVVKFGTAVLTQKENKQVDLNVMSSVGRVINAHQSPISVVTSGAVGFGKTLGSLEHITDKLRKNRAYAARGNRKLFDTWDDMISDKHVWELLVTYAQIENGHRQDILQLIEDALNVGDIPMFNFNDAVSGKELMVNQKGEFGDNDHLASDVAECATEVSSKARLIIATAAHGVQEDLKHDDSTIARMRTGDLTESEIEKLCGESSDEGTGGMDQKLRYIRDLLNRNSDVTEGWIINGKNEALLESILSGVHPEQGATLITVA